MNMTNMFLKPTELWREFVIERKSDDTNSRGREVNAWAKDDPVQIVTGILASMSPEEVEKFKQMQHPVSHQIAQQGSPKAKPGDRLVSSDDRTFYIEKVNNPAELGIWTVYYCEERGTTDIYGTLDEDELEEDFVLGS
jgi:hypothetical protein